MRIFKNEIIINESFKNPKSHQRVYLIVIGEQMEISHELCHQRLLLQADTRHGRASTTDLQRTLIVFGVVITQRSHYL